MASPPSDKLTVEERLKRMHAGTSHLAINNTWIRRALVLAGLKTTSRLLKPLGRCRRISTNTVVKTGWYVRLAEAATMHFVAEHCPSIPIPKVICSFIHRNRAYIVMERVEGEPIDRVLVNSSEETRRKIIGQLKEMLDELRAIPPPPSGSSSGAVQSCVGGHLRDPLIAHGSPCFGPFGSIHEFHRWLRKDLRAEDIGDDGWTEEERADVREMVARQDGPWPPVVFSHGDLNPTNILAKGDRVTGIIDWESSGWLPHYWDYTNAATLCEVVMTGWVPYIEQILDAHPEQLKMERTRQRYWGEI